MTEKFTYNQIIEQRDAGKSPTVLVRRTSGQIETAAYTGIKDARGHYYDVVLNQKDEKGDNYHRSMRAEELTDEGQALLAQELAESVSRSPEAWERSGKVEKGLADAALEQTVADASSKSDNKAAEAEQRPEIKLKPENIERSTAELERVFGGELAAIFPTSLHDATERRSAIDPNSGDTELRKQLEIVLRKRIDELGDEQKLPERVQRNSPQDLKNIPSDRFGYDKDKYSPRDYASKVALAMLDGSFDGDPRKVDYADLPADDPRNGQHRQTARMVLDTFAEQKASQEQQQDDAEHDDEALDDIKRALRQLNDEEMFQRAKVNGHQLSDQYYQGLPHFFETQEVKDQLDQHGALLSEVAEDIEQVLRRIATVNDQIKAQNQRIVEQIQMEMVNAHTQVENARQIEYMLAAKMDELAYDQNAQLEVRSLFAQQLPLALNSLAQAFARIESAAH